MDGCKYTNRPLQGVHSNIVYNSKRKLETI